MACLAGNPVRMFCSVDLGKILRPGGAGLVAPNAEHCRIRFSRINRWILGMLYLRSVAGFAVHMRMFARALGLGDIGVTCFAGLVSGKMLRPSCNLGNRRTPVMSVFPEAPWNHKASEHKERQGSDHKEQR